MNEVNNSPSIKLRVPETVPNETGFTSPAPNMDDRVDNASVAQIKLDDITRAKQTEDNQQALKQLADKLNEKFVAKNTSLSFSIDEDTSVLVVKVINADNDEVIRQIPPDEILAIRKNIQSMIGTILDKEA